MRLKTTRALALVAVLAAAAIAGTADPSSPIRAIPDDLVKYICLHHLPDLKDIERMAFTSEALNGLLNSSLRDLRDLLNDYLPDTEFRPILPRFVAESQLHPADRPTSYADAKTALRLYDRWEAGCYDGWTSRLTCMIRALILRIHPIVFGAVLASISPDDPALLDILDLAPVQSIAFPPLPAQITNLVTQIVNGLPQQQLPENVTPELVEKVHRRLSHLEAPFDRIYPFNELVAQRLVTELLQLPGFQRPFSHDVQQALAWRGIRCKARHFLEHATMATTLSPDKLQLFEKWQMRLGNTEDLLRALWDATWHNHLGYRRALYLMFRDTPDLRRRLYHVLTSPLEKFPWNTFCKAFCPSYQDQPPQSSVISNALFRLVGALYSEYEPQRHALADFLLTCAADHDQADVSVLVHAVKMFVRFTWKLSGERFDEFMQGPHFRNLNYIDTVWAVLEDIDYQGNLLPHFLSIPEILAGLRSSRLPLILDIIPAVWRMPFFETNVLTLFADLPAFVEMLKQNMAQYVDVVGQSFVGPVRISSDDWWHRSLEPNQALQTAMQLDFWPEMLNLKGPKRGTTLLHWAMLFSNQGAMRALCNSEGIDITQVDRDGHGPLYHCMMFDNLLGFIYVLQQLPIQHPLYRDQIVADVDGDWPGVHAPPDILAYCFQIDHLRDLLITKSPRIRQAYDLYCRTLSGSNRLTFRMPYDTEPVHT